MAELATIARPYAEALFKAAGHDGPALKGQLAVLAQLAADPQLRQFADNPKVPNQQVIDVLSGIAVSQGVGVDARVGNLVATVVDNGRLSALPEIATQFSALVNQSTGVSDAVVQSAFPLEPAQLADVVGALERRFNRRLNPTVEVNPELIGGVRVIVGDEVLDTSVRARLEQMKTALTA
jgi:F-type H+-transporting ATPase subunit delta